MALIIRNLTPTVLELRLVERFERPNGEHPTPTDKGLWASISCFAQYISSFLYSQSLNLDERSGNAQRLEHREASICIDQFATYKTDIEAPENHVLALTFRSEGQTYRVDVPVPTSKSVPMDPLATNPKYQYAAIYLPRHHHLAIFLSSTPQQWMRELNDQTPLTGLSIPGTHNSPTCHRALPSVRCQAVPPRAQLENGIRFFDIRVQPENHKDADKDGLLLVHSAFSVALTGRRYLRNLVDEVINFLDANPSETVLISLKREGTGNSTDAHLGHVLRRHYAGDVKRWFTAPRIPNLGEVRGKIVLIRRFAIDDELKTEWNGEGWGIDASTWADNTPHAFTPNGQLCIQDFYEVLETENIEKKIQYSTEQLSRSAATITPVADMGIRSAREIERQPLFINFLSASNLWKTGCWPERIAAKLNPAVVDYLCRVHNEPAEGRQVGDGCTGIVVCDWVGNGGDWDLVRAIVGWNSRLALKERSK